MSWKLRVRAKIKECRDVKILKAGEEGHGRGGNVTNTDVLTEALIANYSDMKKEFDDLEGPEQAEFLEMLGGDLKDNFDKGPAELEMYVNILEESECAEVVDRLLAFLDRVSPAE